MENKMNFIKSNDFPHLPNCKANHGSIHHAMKFKLCTESLLSAPKSAIIDGIISYGGSTSIGLKLPKKAYGEFHERNHLFTQVRVDQHKKLSEVLPEKYREKLLSLCQLKNGDTQRCLNHEFSFTTVHNIFDEKPYDYFYNAISLNCNKPDSPFINFSDSCACAAHPQKNAALHNSLMEFVERQALLGSWLSQTYQYTINPELLREVTPYTELVDLLLDNGELFIFQNGNQLPGHTVIMFYFSQSADDIVQYSIGSSSGLTLEEALLSTLEELYQCYSFLYNAESSEGLENKAGAGYHLAFQNCNRQSVRETIPFMQDIRPYHINSLTDLQQERQYTYQEVLDELSTISPDLYYYHAYDKSLKLHYTKILSPDFFVHMSLNNNLNVENKYAQNLKITRENAYMQKIPFP
jgi:hypothetical protein